MVASANWFTRFACAPASTSSSETATSEKVTTYSSEWLDVGVFVTCTPSAFADTTTTALSAVTMIQSACPA